MLIFSVAPGFARCLLFLRQPQHGFQLQLQRAAAQLIFRKFVRNPELIFFRQHEQQAAQLIFQQLLQQQQEHRFLIQQWVLVPQLRWRKLRWRQLQRRRLIQKQRRRKLQRWRKQRSQVRFNF